MPSAAGIRKPTTAMNRLAPAGNDFPNSRRTAATSGVAIATGKSIAGSLNIASSTSRPARHDGSCFHHDQPEDDESPEEPEHVGLDVSGDGSLREETEQTGERRRAANEQ